MPQLTSQLARAWRLRGPLFKGVLLGMTWFFASPHDLGTGAVVFALIALFLYFVPFFRPSAVLPQFLAVFLLGFFLPHGALAALGYGILFFLLFGIRNLDIVERDIAYEMFVFIALFMSAEELFRSAPHWASVAGLLGALLYAALFWMLTRALPWEDKPGEERRRSILPVLSTALVFELAVALLFLPIEFISSACILFLFTVFLSLFIERSTEREVSAVYLAKAFGAFVLATGFILVFSSWKI